MGRRRRERDTVSLPEADGTDEQLLVVSPKVAKHAKRAEKENAKAAKAERELAEAERRIAAGEAGGKDGKDGKPAGSELTGAKVKRYIAIARIVVPVVAPIVYQAVGSARSAWDQHRARQLGVAPDELAEFSGRGSALHARVHHLAVSARDLRTRRGSEDQVRRFVDEAEGRLADLESAVRAAEQMPAARRRAAHAAVADEVERIESRLLGLWGVDAAPGTLPPSPRAGA